MEYLFYILLGLSILILFTILFLVAKDSKALCEFIKESSKEWKKVFKNE